MTQMYVYERFSQPHLSRGWKYLIRFAGKCTATMSRSSRSALSVPVRFLSFEYIKDEKCFLIWAQTHLFTLQLQIRNNSSLETVSTFLFVPPMIFGASDIKNISQIRHQFVRKKTWPTTLLRSSFGDRG